MKLVSAGFRRYNRDCCLISNPSCSCCSYYIGDSYVLMLLRCQRSLGLRRYQNIAVTSAYMNKLLSKRLNFTLVQKLYMFSVRPKQTIDECSTTISQIKTLTPFRNDCPRFPVLVVGKKIGVSRLSVFSKTLG